jgi:hypothetical protein
MSVARYFVYLRYVVSSIFFILSMYASTAAVSTPAVSVYAS